MDIEKCIERLEDAKREFDKAMAECKQACEDAVKELRGESNA